MRSRLQSETNRRADGYESQFMSDPESETIYREKMHMPALVRFGVPVVLLLQFGLFLTLGFVLPAPGSFLFLGLTPVIFIVVLLAFSMGALRVSVSKRKLMVQNGIFGPTVDLDKIELCESVQYDAIRQFGGWGIRIGFDGTRAYNILGDKGRAVRVHYRTSSGKLKKLLFSTARPDEVVEAITSWRKLRPAAS